MDKRFAIFVGIVQAILFFGHWLLYLSLVTLLEIPDSPLRTGLAITVALLSVSFVLASVLSFRSDALPVRWFYVIAAVWLGLLHILILASLIGWIFIGVLELVDPPQSSRTLGLAVYASGLLVAGLALARMHSPRVTRRSVVLPNLPESWRGRTLVFISDLHLGHIRRERFLRRVTATIEQLAPAVVGIGGDLFDGSRINAASLVRPLEQLARRHQTFFITGNHELFSGYQTFVDIVAATGVSVLDDAKQEIDGLQLAGISWPTSRHPNRMAAALDKMQLDRSRSTVLLVHAPDRLDIALKAGVALQISGHTHRGQLWPFNLIADRVYRGFAYGLHPFEHMMVCTCSGTGTWGPPLRLGSRSEIVEITFA